MPLTEHPQGNYRFLPGIAPYSGGVVSSPGHEIVHVTLQQPVPYRAGLEQVAEYLPDQGRPLAALCAVELRSPAPFTFPGFIEFNRQYAAILERWGVFVNGVNPVARTNVAPLVKPPAEPLLAGFSYTRPCPKEIGPTFVVAGAGELPEGTMSREEIVALADVSAPGLEQKSKFVLQLMEERLFGLGANWSQVSAVNVYTVHTVPSLLERLVKHIPPSSLHGVTCHLSRPPIEEIEFEMDVRGTRTDLRF